MLKKLSLSRFNEQQLDSWGNAIRLGSTDRNRIRVFQLALFFLGAILITGILIIPSKYNFQSSWIEKITLFYTLILFGYMGVLFFLNRKKEISLSLYLLSLEIH